MKNDVDIIKVPSINIDEIKDIYHKYEKIEVLEVKDIPTYDLPVSNNVEVLDDIKDDNKEYQIKKVIKIPLMTVISIILLLNALGIYLLGYISYGYYINAISIIFAIISIIEEKKYYSFITIILNIIMLIYYLIFFNNIAV